MLKLLDSFYGTPRAHPRGGNVGLFPKLGTTYRHPEVIVLGGGLSLIDAIVEKLPDAIQTHLFSGFAVPEVKRAKFGDSSGVRGAAIIGSVHANSSAS